MAKNTNFVGVAGLPWSCCESPDIDGHKMCSCSDGKVNCQFKKQNRLVC